MCCAGGVSDNRPFCDASHPARNTRPPSGTSTLPSLCAITQAGSGQSVTQLTQTPMHGFADSGVYRVAGPTPQSGSRSAARE